LFLTSLFLQDLRRSPTYSGKFDPPRAPDLQELQTPKPLPLPMTAAHLPVMLASSPALSVAPVKVLSVVA
jgi:hypothetical protein